jgi:hypothetical protein
MTVDRSRGEMESLIDSLSASLARLQVAASRHVTIENENTHNHPQLELNDGTR